MHMRFRIRQAVLPMLVRELQLKFPGQAALLPSVLLDVWRKKELIKKKILFADIVEIMIRCTAKIHSGGTWSHIKNSPHVGTTFSGDKVPKPMLMKRTTE